MKRLLFLLAAIGFSGCGIVSKQYYYVPSVPYQKVKIWHGYTNFRIAASKLPIRNNAGDSIGSMITANGVGQLLLIGPLVPVIPVGGFTQKSARPFRMDLAIYYNKGYSAQLTIDSNNYQPGRNHSKATGTTNAGPCYMIVNDTTKVLLEGWRSSFIRGDSIHAYTFTGDTWFSKVKAMKLVTGNPILDSTLKNISFTRKSRIKFNILPPMGY